MKRKIVVFIISLCVVFSIGLSVCYGIVSANASGRTYDIVEAVPEMEYGLLLGTSPITSQGAHNFYFDNRIKAAAELFHTGKIKKIIASGGDYSDKQKNGCNELTAMRDSLVAYGVPARYIYLDYDGIRTINSIVKVKEVLGKDSCIIISQEYHNQRAIWHADHYGLKAVAYNALPSPFWKNRVKNIAREVFARPKMFLDLWFEDKPSFENRYTAYLFDLKNGKFENGDLTNENVDCAIMQYSSDINLPYYRREDIRRGYNQTDSILKILCESNCRPLTTVYGGSFTIGIDEINFMNWWLINNGIRKMTAQYDACRIEKEKALIDSLIIAEQNFARTHIESAGSDNGSLSFIKHCNIKHALYSDWNQQLQDLVFNIGDLDVKYDSVSYFPMSYIANEFSRLRKHIKPYMLDEIGELGIDYNENNDIHALMALEKAWNDFIVYRNSLSGKLWTDGWNDIYDNATNRFKRSFLILLKNEFEGMGLLNDDMEECLLYRDCSDAELFSYPGFSIKWKEYCSNFRR